MALPTRHGNQDLWNKPEENDLTKPMKVRPNCFGAGAKGLELEKEQHYNEWVTSYCDHNSPDRFGNRALWNTQFEEQVFGVGNANGFGIGGDREGAPGSPGVAPPTDGLDDPAATASGAPRFMPHGGFSAAASATEAQRVQDALGATGGGTASTAAHGAAFVEPSASAEAAARARGAPGLVPWHPEATGEAAAAHVDGGGTAVGATLGEDTAATTDAGRTKVPAWTGAHSPPADAPANGAEPDGTHACYPCALGAPGWGCQGVCIG